jgi:hypothetical protein
VKAKNLRWKTGPQGLPQKLRRAASLDLGPQPRLSDIV